MLKPSECSVGPISAGPGLTLVLPRETGGPTMLVVGLHDQRHVVFLTPSSGIDPFMSFECGSNNYWKGILIENVEIEIDVKSVPARPSRQLPLGTLTRTQDKLTIEVKSQAWIDPLVIMDGLPACAEGSSASFLTWQIVLGQGESKRVLHRVDVSPSPGPLS